MPRFLATIADPIWNRLQALTPAVDGPARGGA